MPTVAERLATIEAIVSANAARLDRMEDLYSGDGEVPYERSIRGRLHKLESVAAGAVLRRNFGVGLLKGWERLALVLCALATAAAAWYSVISG